jgi:serine/threonine protein kinase
MIWSQSYQELLRCGAGPAGVWGKRLRQSMTQERMERVRQLFAGALELPSSERSGFLVRNCGSDQELIAQVESLLSKSNTTTSILGLRLRRSRPSSTGNPFDVNCAGPRDQSILGARLKERYLLQRELGRGGFGVVYLATDEQLLSRPVVVKIMLNARPDSWERRKFRNEIEALARVNHPGVVSVLDLGETEDGRPFLAMEYVEGTPLRALIRPEGMDLERVADLIRQIGGALEATHKNGVWHRDLKPENIMVQTLEDGDQRIKLIDFGIASVKGPDTFVDSTTRIVGTFRYMAPEQLRGKPSAASDVYGLAVIAYEMVTGRTPFNAETPLELYAMKMEGVQIGPKSLRPSLPDQAESSILKALQPAEGNRHPTIRVFVQEMLYGLKAAKEPGSPRSKRDPHFGRLVSKMCNRRSQEDEFRGFLARSVIRHPGQVIFCLIHGDEGECHESLVERFAYGAELLARMREGCESPSVKVLKIPWQYEGSLELRLRRLVAWLFERVGMDHGASLDDTSPPAFGGLLALSTAPFMFLQHDVRAGRWDNLTKSLIQSYRSYLSEVPRAIGGPQIVVCLNVIYPRDSNARWQRGRFDFRAGVRRLKKRRIRRILAEIADAGARAQGSQTDFCLLLDEIKSITRDDVLEWFSLHNILETEEQRLQAAGQIFGGVRKMSTSKSMAEVETRLKTVQRTFLIERGFI